MVLFRRIAGNPGIQIVKRAHLAARRTNQRSQRERETKVAEHVQLPDPQRSCEHTGLCSSRREIPIQRYCGQNTGAYDRGPLSPGPGETDVDDVADQEQANNDSVSQDRSDVPVGIHQVIVDLVQPIDM